MKKLIIMILSAVLLIAAGCGSQKESEQAQPESKEQPATQDNAAQGNAFHDLSSFTAMTIDGSPFTQDDFADYDVTVINVWSTTCPPCIDEMPVLGEIAASLPDHVRLISWCLDGESNKSIAQSILDESGYRSVTLTAGDGDMAAFYRQLMYTPTTVAVDNKGRLIGQPLIGAPRDPQAIYADFINQALTAIGKEPLS